MKRHRTHEEFMRAAIALARKGLGSTSPNPAVGALVVKSGRVIGSGWHRKAGLAHAEIEAMKGGRGLKGSTLYVTLEPCCHFGRTPPCTAALIGSGIKTVVIGALDPNPRVSGRGAKALRSAGIEVVTGVLSEECRALNERYNAYITRKTPFVTLKLASSMDGRIATASGESRWITGEESRAYAHGLRAMNDAILVGASTVIKDDPELTVRHAKGQSPVRVVLDGSFRVPLTARVFDGLGKCGRLVIFTARSASAAKIRKARSLGAEVITLPASREGLPLKKVLQDLGRMEITGLLVEGGSRVAASFIKAGLVDKYVLFYAPRILGGDGVASVASIGLKSLKHSPALTGLNIKRIGEDLVVEAYPLR